MDYGEFRAVPHIIEETADRFPDRVAVCYGRRTLTYRQLDELANGIAIAAAERGVVKGDRVATLLGNSLETPACYLAMMKLGAVFVPVDSRWPADRLDSTLRVLSARLILCADSAPSALDQAAMPVGAATPSSRRPRVPLGPGDLCYGFFTSGTTGIPKCAMNVHGGLANRLRFMTRWFAPGEDAVVLQNSKPIFDSSLWQIMLPLATGGRTVLPRAGEFLDLEQTINTIAEHRVTATDFVSSVFNAFVAIPAGDEVAQRKLSSLRHLIVGSEEINARAVHQLRAMLPRVRITNGYGPTETAIGMVFHLISDADGDDIPIGKPIDNCYVAVLGEDGNPQPAGAVGEIVIGGACVGAGYHGDLAATEKAFIPNPFPSRIPGDRLYLSGDFGYLDDQGRIFFSGRKDFQVKIGGVRIELGEIEAAAQRCPGVYQAKAMVAERDGVKSLAVFAAGSGELTQEGLHERLRGMLPRTSVPRYCLVLPRMPLGEGGKVDRGSLQAMLAARLDASAAAAAEADADAGLESWGGHTLRAFRVALGQPDLRDDADFIAAGGDSLRALIAVRMLSDECGVPDLCVLDLIENPTARALAELIATREPSDAAAAAETAQIERDTTLGEVPVIRTARSSGELRTVLVTGATGFVGSRLVHDLLASTDMRVLCVARGNGDSEAAERVACALAERGLWEPRFADRLEGYAGDLSQTSLGLADRVWDHLASTCDLIVHNGALVNLLFSYTAHRAPNVAGTAEVLRLAMERRPVPVHYVSTLAAVQAEAMRRRARLPDADARLPEAEPSADTAPARGYSVSKWAAERYLAMARHRGATITVLRLGEVLPSRQHTHPSPRALTHLLLSAIHQLGVSPRAAIRSDYTPVDYASARVVAAVSDRAAWGRVLHVFHPRSVDFTAALASVGAPVAETTCAAFLTRLRESAKGAGGRELAALAALLPAPDDRDESSLRRELATLLTDNPALYRKDECRRLEQRWELPDEDPRGAIAAYHGYLDRHGNRNEKVSCDTERWAGSPGK